jgi:hypothetical protein
MDRRPASRTGADRPGEEREPATVVAGLRARLGGLEPSDEGGGGLTVEQLEEANVGASAQQIDALLAPGTDVLVPESGQVDSRAEEFDVDLASDYEHERLLMYRVILAFEIVVAIILIRELGPIVV